MGIGSAVIAEAAHAIGVDDDEAIRDILRRRVEEKLTLGMAVCVVTPSRKRVCHIIGSHPEGHVRADVAFK